MSEVTAEAEKAVYGETRSWVVTRANFAGTGKYAGHWLGDNYSTWKDLRNSIVGMLDMNLFGIPYIGFNIFYIDYYYQKLFIKVRTFADSFIK